MPAESANVKIPDNSHFHPLALLEWEKEIIWDTENTESSSNAGSKGMFVSLNTQNLGPTSTVQPTVSSATPGSSQSPSLNTNAAASGVSLSSILSSLSFLTVPLVIRPVLQLQPQPCSPSLEINKCDRLPFPPGLLPLQLPRVVHKCLVQLQTQMPLLLQPLNWNILKPCSTCY